MKLIIGENIRDYRKKNNLTQEQFAERLGVTYQSVSRWENGTTYPDLELLPAISDLLSITVDELLGMPEAKKEEKAKEAFDELRRECIKRNYDADRIVAIIRDIRRNHMDSDWAWRPWCEGNEHVFRDPKILPEVRLMAENYLERHPMDNHTLRTMANIEDEKHLENFLEKNTSEFDCSRRKLLFDRYWFLRNIEKFEPERRYQLYFGIEMLLYPTALIGLYPDTEKKNAADEFMEKILELIRDKADGNKPDMWIIDRLELGFKRAARLAAEEKYDEALSVISDCVALLEETMNITDEVVLPTSCRFLDGMKWTAKEDWSDKNNPDADKERYIFISTTLEGASNCYCVFPSQFEYELSKKCFDALRTKPEFISLKERVNTLIVTRKDN